MAGSIAVRSIVPLNPARRIEWKATPEQVLAHWPADEPLAVLYSGKGPIDQARWSVLARPSETISVRAGEDWVRACPFLSRLARRDLGVASAGPFFAGGWLGWISYDFGREVERSAQHGQGAARDREWATMQWHRCDQALVHDRAAGAWWVVGDGWEHLWDGEIGLALSREGGKRSSSPADFRTCREPDESAGEQREKYMAACERVLAYIRAGDVYQVNLAHRLSHKFEGSARAAFRSLLDAASPWFGAYTESTRGDVRQAVCSVSPELLFRLDGATGRITTRPMKGTRAPGLGAAEALRESEKDRAELNMIVDLMRNDLGRVCEFGSVRVERPREVEWHGQDLTFRSEGRSTEEAGAGAGILQATATVGGVVRSGITLADVIRALVPGGSVTGAPKIRAMQIIDELESVRRGPYCGAVGFAGDDGSCAMNVGIRTALITGRVDAGTNACDRIVEGVVDYSVGAGIVADSVPDLEWMETLQKAGVWRRGFLDRH